MNTDEIVMVFKNGKDVGWYRDLESGKNAIRATCKNMSFDISEYEIRQHFEPNIVTWQGSFED